MNSTPAGSRETALATGGDPASRPRRRASAGRRRGPSSTRARILEAARARFAAHGYAGTTIRAVAADAGVDPALVHYFFKTKDGLFAAAMALPVNPVVILERALDGGIDGLGERLVRGFLEMWDDAVAEAALVALIRSASSHEGAAAMLRGFLEREVAGRLAEAIDAPDARLRATLAGSHLAGLAIARYVLRVEPLASAPRTVLVGAIAPALQRYVSGSLDETGAPR